MHRGDSNPVQWQGFGHGMTRGLASGMVSESRMLPKKKCIVDGTERRARLVSIRRSCLSFIPQVSRRSAGHLHLQKFLPTQCSTTDLSRFTKKPSHTFDHNMSLYVPHRRSHRYPASVWSVRHSQGRMCVWLLNGANEACRRNMPS